MKLLDYYSNEQVVVVRFVQSILMVVLSYLEISYKEWLKAIWKLLVELLLVCFGIIFTLKDNVTVSTLNVDLNKIRRLRFACMGLAPMHYNDAPISIGGSSSSSSGNYSCSCISWHRFNRRSR